MAKYVYSITIVGGSGKLIGYTENLAVAKKRAGEMADKLATATRVHRSYIKKDGMMAAWKEVARVKPWSVGQRANPSNPSNDNWAKAKSYVKRIRNKEKKRYAQAVLRHLMGYAQSPDSSTYNISYMAAQGVRLELQDLTGLEVNPSTSNAGWIKAKAVRILRDSRGRVKAIQLRVTRRK